LAPCADSKILTTIDGAFNLLRNRKIELTSKCGPSCL